jgi:hypothetical protein
MRTYKNRLDEQLTVYVFPFVTSGSCKLNEHDSQKIILEESHDPRMEIGVKDMKGR